MSLGNHKSFFLQLRVNSCYIIFRIFTKIWLITQHGSCKYCKQVSGAAFASHIILLSIFCRYTKSIQNEYNNHRIWHILYIIACIVHAIYILCICVASPDIYFYYVLFPIRCLYTYKYNVQIFTQSPMLTTIPVHSPFTANDPEKARFFASNGA